MFDFQKLFEAVGPAPCTPELAQLVRARVGKSGAQTINSRILSTKEYGKVWVEYKAAKAAHKERIKFEVKKALMEYFDSLGVAKDPCLKLWIEEAYKKTAGAGFSGGFQNVVFLSKFVKNFNMLVRKYRNPALFQ